MRVATVDAVDDQRELVPSPELTGFADGWFGEGVLTFETGNNAGVSKWTESSLTLDLWAVRLMIQVGNPFRLYPGCHERLKACINRFHNGLHFRGAPSVPPKEGVPLPRCRLLSWRHNAG